LFSQFFKYQLLVCCLISFSAHAQTDEIKVFPDGKVYTFEGDSTSIHQIAKKSDKPTLICIWYGYHVPTKKGMQTIHLNELPYQEKLNTIAVNLDLHYKDDLSREQAYVKSKGWKIPSYYAKGFREFFKSQVPGYLYYSWFMIDSDANVIWWGPPAGSKDLGHFLKKEYRAKKTKIDSTTETTPNHIPNVSLKDREKKDHKILDLVGKSNKPTLLCFWHTWCPEVKKTLNNLNEEDYLDKQDSINILLINGDDDRNVNKAYLLAEGRGWEYPNYHDPNRNLAKALVHNEHTWVLVDKKGKVLWRGYSADDLEELNTFLNDHFN
jgi:hypothetical protein